MNDHPADELADVRAKIRELKEREEVLRSRLIDGTDLRGTMWRATVRVQTSERIDLAAAKRVLGPKVLAPFLYTTESTSVRLHKADWQGWQDAGHAVRPHRRMQRDH